MKFISTKEAILSEIIYTVDFTTQKNSLAITSNVYLQTLGDQLLIKATDGKWDFPLQSPSMFRKKEKLLFFRKNC